MEYIKMVDDILRKAYDVIDFNHLPDDQIDKFKDYLKKRIDNLIAEMEENDE